MNYSKGKWTTKRCEGGGLLLIRPYAIQSSVQILPEDDAHLIAASVNACISVNPDNPLAAAQSIKDMYEALKECLNILDLQRTEYNQTPSILPRNPVGEGPIAKMSRKALAKADGK